jgi:hypothetical protein
MAKLYDTLNPDLTAFIQRQKIFFVATTAPEARINLSPKGLDSLRVLDASTLAYVDVTGSSAETAAHLRADARMTLMFCSFTADPLLLRVYGRGESVLPGSARWDELAPGFSDYFGARQIVVLHVTSAQTSCGTGVPLMDYVGQRGTLVKWAEKKGEAGLAQYRQEKNAVSIDGLPTGLV